MAYKEHPNTFQSLKWIQFAFSFIVFILEMIQIGSNSSLYNKLTSINNNISLDKISPLTGIPIEKQFVYFAFLFSILSISVYLVKFKTIWSHKNGPFIWFEVSLCILWLVESIINLENFFKGYGTIESDLANLTNDVPQEIFTSFNSYVASIAFSWLNVILFVVSTFIAYKVNVEKSKISSLQFRQQAKTHNIKVIKYCQNSEHKRVTFVRNNEKNIKEKVVMFKEGGDKNDNNENFDDDADLKV